MAERILLEDEFFRVFIDDEQKMMRVKRTDKPFPSLEAVRGSNALRFEATKHVAGQAYVLLLDMREGPLRNDPAFEQETRTARAQMFSAFARIAVLLRTAVGVLQLERLQRTENVEKLSVPHQVFHDDEPAALAFLHQR